MCIYIYTNVKEGVVAYPGDDQFDVVVVSIKITTEVVVDGYSVFALGL